MTYNPSFEVPAQRFGEVISHDRYTVDQLRMFKLIDSFGRSSVSQTVELEDESIEQVVEVSGQYL